MSQPHPPHPEDRSGTAEPAEPRTQSIPVVTPEGQPSVAQPGPAFSTEAGYHPGSAPASGPEQTPGPPTAPPPPTPPQTVPPEEDWSAPARTDQAGWPLETGPIDFVPGFSSPGAGSPAGMPPAAGSTAVTATSELPAVGGTSADAGRQFDRGEAPEASRRPSPRRRPKPSTGAAAGPGPDRTVLAGLGLAVVGLVLLELGLVLDFGNESLWSVVPTWSAFTTVAAVVVLFPLVRRWVPRAPDAATSWRIGAIGGAGLAAFWVLVGLPLVASDRGFLLTAGFALAGAALWLAPGRGSGTTGTGARTGGPA